MHRFNAHSMHFLEDSPRSGRPETYIEEQHGQIIATAKTHRQQLQQAYGYWTLDRLTGYVNEQLHIRIWRSQIANVLDA